MLENIIITGITNLNSYPSCRCKNYCKQCMETDFLCVPDEKPNIESINEVKVSMCVEDFKIFDTILGPKLLVNGVKNIKIIYTANNCEQSLHSSHWNIPFCEFVLLKDIPYDECCSLINNVFIGVENVCVKHYDKKLIDLSVLFIICPKIITEHFKSCTKTNNSKNNFNPCMDCYNKPNIYYNKGCNKRKR